MARILAIFCVLIIHTRTHNMLNSIEQLEPEEGKFLFTTVSVFYLLHFHEDLLFSYTLGNVNLEMIEFTNNNEETSWRAYVLIYHSCCDTRKHQHHKRIIASKTESLHWTLSFITFLYWLVFPEYQRCTRAISNRSRKVAGALCSANTVFLLCVLKFTALLIIHFSTVFPSITWAI